MWLSFKKNRAKNCSIPTKQNFFQKRIVVLTGKPSYEKYMEFINAFRRRRELVVTEDRIKEMCRKSKHRYRTNQRERDMA